MFNQRACLKKVFVFGSCCHSNQLKAITNLWPSICCLCEKFVKIIFWGCCLQPSWQWAKADKTARTNVRKFLTLSNSSNWLSLDIRTIINKIAQVNLKQTNYILIIWITISKFTSLCLCVQGMGVLISNTSGKYVIVSQCKGLSIYDVRC